jgi:hypothetical protein
MGIGPFVAIKPGEGEIIDAIAMGVMWGFKEGESSDKSFNLGLGAYSAPS